MTKKILAVTGIRSDYDILSSVFKAIESHPELSLDIVVTGAHLSENYGLTLSIIDDDGFNIVDKIESLFNSDTDTSRVKGLGVQIQGLVQTVSRIKPDFLLVLGDREESISTALVASYLNIPLAHLCGGDRVVGNVDDQIRHAVTKLSHIHFTTNCESYERVLRLGEQPFRVFNVGNPGLDRLLTVPNLSLQQISKQLSFSLHDDQPLLLVIQHVLSSEIPDAYDQMRITLESIAELGLQTVLSYPNSDAGGQQMIKAIDLFSDLPNLFCAKNIPRLEFVNLFRRASCLLGNSSAGILEAPLLKIPVVNVGNRQKGRLHAENVTFVPHDKSSIVNAVKRCIYDYSYIEQVKLCANPYGDGHSSDRIADILASTQVNKKLLIKDITF